MKIKDVKHFNLFELMLKESLIPGFDYLTDINNPFYDPEYMDFIYKSEYGERTVSPYLQACYDTLYDDNSGFKRTAITAFKMSYMEKWARIYKAYTAEYNLLNNTEWSETYTKTNKNAGSDSESSNRNSENVSNISESSKTNIKDNAETDSNTKESNSNNGSVEKLTAGFNTEDGYTPNEKEVNNNAGESGSNTSERVTNNSDQNNEAEGNTKGEETESYTNTKEYNNEHTETFKHEKSGNIGVTTSAQLVKGEIELLQYNYLKQVFVDVTDLIALQIYEGEY